MINLFLIRHGECDSLGKVLNGRRPSIFLNADGVNQAENVGLALHGTNIQLVISSPLDRTVQTASIISKLNHIPLRICDDLNEIDCGKWTGQQIDLLQYDKAFTLFNTNRMYSEIPDGENIIKAQCRMVRCVELLTREYFQSVAVVSHGDPIKLLLSYYLGIPVNNSMYLDISPASVSLLTLDSYGVTLHYCNKTFNKEIP